MIALSVMSLVEACAVRRREPEWVGDPGLLDCLTCRGGSGASAASPQ
jgi:hypothetical protein